MEKLILSTKGELKYRLIFIIVGIIGVLMSIFAFSIYVKVSPYAEETRRIGLLASSGSLAFGIFAFLYSFMHCSSHILLYSNHCEGKGIQGKGIKNFYLSNNQIKNVTSESYFLCLHTEIGEFKIICSQKYHREAMAYFNNFKS